MAKRIETFITSCAEVIFPRKLSCCAVSVLLVAAATAGCNAEVENKGSAGVASVADSEGRLREAKDELGGLLGPAAPGADFSLCQHIPRSKSDPLTNTSR